MSSPSSIRKCLILVDVQYDFLESGSLAVPNSNQVLSPIYKLIDSNQWSLIIASQDYHPVNHISFSSRHPNSSPFTKIQTTSMTGGGDGGKEQDLWPDHCVQNTKGCEIEEGIMMRLKGFVERGEGDKVKIVRKGYEKDQDAYSAFHSIDAAPTIPGISPKSLASVLQESNLQEIYLVGLATDYCVKATTLDALKESKEVGGWKVFVIEEACRGVDPVKSVKVLKELKKAGAEIVGIDGVEMKKVFSS